jgi:hypothetical protein
VRLLSLQETIFDFSGCILRVLSQQREFAILCTDSGVWRAMRQTLNPVVAKVLKRLHYPLGVILLCVRWYSAYPLSLRNLEHLMSSLL